MQASSTQPSAKRLMPMYEPYVKSELQTSVVYPFEISSPLIKGRNFRKNSNWHTALMRRLASLSLDRRFRRIATCWLRGSALVNVSPSMDLCLTLGPGSGSTGRGHEMQGTVGPAGLIIPFRVKITIISQEKALNITLMPRIRINLRQEVYVTNLRPRERANQRKVEGRRTRGGTG